ncbi:MGA_1079 family surface serine endopeptidase [Mycoplasmopsis canis]|uniref:MGA_1079 family surface serine endopeptidase n=1 Tax=Mycoplasmopsis canis TaxID=29555 RepID=UPI0002D9ADD6|nr:hypothetical protein [Mycoplasmopsis canis]
MKKVKKISLLSILTVSQINLAACTSLNNNNNNNNNINSNKIINFIDKAQLKEFYTIKNELKNNKNIEIDNEKTEQIILFLTKYLNILNFKTTKLHEGLTIDYTKEEMLNNKLNEYNKIINSKLEGLLKINSIMINQVETTFELMKELEKERINKNLEFNIFVNEAKLINVSFSNLNKFLYSNLEKIFNKNNLKNNILNEIKNIDKNFQKIIELKNFLNKNNDYRVNSKKIENEVDLFLEEEINIRNFKDQKTRLYDYINILKKYIKDNDLIPYYIKSKKLILKSRIKSWKHLEEEIKSNLFKKLETIFINSELDDFEKELDKLNYELYSKKDKLKIQINSSNISNSNKEYLNSIVSSIDDINELDNFYIKFDKISNDFNELQTIIEKIRRKISANKFKPKYSLEFYKKIPKITELVDKENKLSVINILNLEDNHKIKELLNEIKVLETKESSDDSNNNESILELFKKETAEKFSLSYTENSKEYNLDYYSYSASYNIENSKIIFDNKDTHDVDYEIINLELDNDNRNKLIATVKVILKGNPNINYQIQVSKTFNNDIYPFINSIDINVIDDVFDIKYNEIKMHSLNEFVSMSIDERKSFFIPKLRKINRFFSYKIDNDFEYNENKLFISLKILFNNQIIKTLKLPTLNTIEFIEDKNERIRYKNSFDEENILKIVNGNGDYFMSKLNFKDGAKSSHINYLASDAKKAFQDLYTMPSYGEFETFIKDLVNVDNYNGTADLIIWYKKNGKEVHIEDYEKLYSKPKKVKGFKLLNFKDIKPMGDVFTDSDFLEAQTPDSEYIEMINSINESNFNFRFAEAHDLQKNFRSLNVKDLIEQKAFENIEYLIEISNNKSMKGINYDNEAFVPLDSGIYDKDISLNNIDISKLRKDFFVYYYDVKQIGKRGMSFKLGWINKKNDKIRYSNKKEYFLINIVNDYQQTLYPEIMLNNIKLSDLEINNNLLSQRTADEWLNDLEELNKVIKLKSNKNNEIEYFNYTLPSSLFKIEQIKRISNNQAYIRFSVLDKNKNKILSNTWIKIKNFARSELNNKDEELEFTNNNLKTVQDSIHSITRERIIEPYWKDLIWNLDKNTNVASWILQKKYLEKTILKENAKNSVLKFNILANSLINTQNKNERVRNINNSIYLEINFDELVENKIIKFDRLASDGNNGFFKFFVTLRWNKNSGIEFKISMSDNSYKIILDEPEAHDFKNENISIDKNKAFIILPAATKTVIEYTNNEENEDFGINQNRFDYKHIEFNEYNQPILYYSDLDFLNNRTVYYPNQNVKFKLHEGYKLDVDYLRIKEWREWDIVNSSYSRSALQNDGKIIGTISFLGKINKDPNDATFYALTNNHVERGPEKFGDLLKDSFLKDVRVREYSFAPEKTSNTIDRFYDLNDTNINTIKNVHAKLLWTGKDQISKDGNIKNHTQDLTLVVIDLNEKLKEAKLSGNMQIVWKIQNLMKMQNVKIDVNHKEAGTISVPNIKEISTLGWPNTKLAGSINRRPIYMGDYANQMRILLGSPYFNPYAQVFIGPGASGTGMFMDNDNYIGTWTFSSSNKHYKASQGHGNNNRKFDFFGKNWSAENPLEIKNYHSIASQIFRANLKFPDKFYLPWFMIKNND